MTERTRVPARDNRLGFHCHDLSHITEGILGNGLRRGEFYNFPPGDLPALQREVTARNIARGVHAPLVRMEWYPQPPTWSFLCDVDRGSRERTFKMLISTLEQVSDFGAEYAIAHYPVPSTDGAGESEERLRSIAWSSADRLAEISVRYGVPLHLEGVGPSPYLTVEFLTAVLSQYTPLRYCFDTGHSQLAARRGDFDLYEFASGLEPYVGSVHLWNLRSREDYETFRHIPVHPSQRPEDGWVDIPRLLGVLGRGSRPLILESGHRYPEELGGHDYREGVKWIKELLQISS